MGSLKLDKLYCTHIHRKMNTIQTTVLILFMINSVIGLPQLEKYNESAEDIESSIHYSLQEQGEILFKSDKWKGAASVHIWWRKSPEISMDKLNYYYSQIVVTKSEKCSYFCTNGFSGGYLGIQERHNNKDKVVIFSVWDQLIEGEAEAIYLGKDTVNHRFGHEGTGVHTHMNYDWHIGETYHFLVMSELSGKKTVFHGWFYRDDLEMWYKIASIQVTKKNKSPYITKKYAFFEDYCHSGELRSALYGPTWVKTEENDWGQIVGVGSSSTNKTKLNHEIFKSGSKTGIIDGGPDLENPYMGKLELDLDKFPCILLKLPGIHVENTSIDHC